MACDDDLWIRDCLYFTPAQYERGGRAGGGAHALMDESSCCTLTWRAG
jgi:hypothetical protein